MTGHLGQDVIAANYGQMLYPPQKVMAWSDFVKDFSWGHDGSQDSVWYNGFQIGPFFHFAGEKVKFRYGRMIATGNVLHWLAQHLGQAGKNDRVNFEFYFPGNTQSVLVIAKYSMIIGSRYLGWMDPTTIPNKKNRVTLVKKHTYVESKHRQTMFAMFSVPEDCVVQFETGNYFCREVIEGAPTLDGATRLTKYEAKKICGRLSCRSFRMRSTIISGVE